MDVKEQKFKIETLKNKLQSSPDKITYKLVKTEYKGHKYNAWEFYNDGKLMFVLCGRGKEDYMPLIVYDELGFATTNIELPESTGMDFHNYVEWFMKKQEEQKNKSVER